MENKNYISNCKKLSLEAGDNKTDLERKRLIHSYTASTQLLSNESCVRLFKTRLKRFRKDNSTDQSLAACLESLPQPNSEWHSSVNSLDMESVVQSPSCYQANLNCIKLNYYTDDYFRNFGSNYSKELKGQGLPKNVSAPLQEIFQPRQNINPVKETIQSGFKTAFEELQEQNSKKFASISGSQNSNQLGRGGQKKRLGMRGGSRGSFVSPLLSTNTSKDDLLPRTSSSDSDKVVDERLKNIEPRMVELIESEIMDCGAPVHWDDIAGLQFAKTAIQEAVVWPLLRPDIFTGLRRPPKGILLFGPPGTGKTLIGKCVASQSKSTFFSISASSLTSKWIGDGEKMVRALFAVARCHQPAIIFIDEIDSLLSQRSETEHESSRRIKTEFLVQLDGATTDSDERLLVIGATNRPQELDEAARRRFVKRLYIPLPEREARLQLVARLMKSERKCLTDENLEEISRLSDGYSGADMKNLCSEASLGPIRSIDMSRMQSIQSSDVRAINMDDFKKALDRVKASVSFKDLEQYVVWNNTYGAGI